MSAAASLQSVQPNQRRQPWVVSVENRQMNENKDSAKDKAYTKTEVPVPLHCCRLQGLRHGCAHRRSGCLRVGVSVRWSGSFLVPPEARWRPGKAWNRVAAMPIKADEVLRVCKGLLSNLQRNAQLAAQDRSLHSQQMDWPRRIILYEII